MADDWTIFRDFSIEHYGLASVFCNIAIETCNFCNRGCEFCPVGHDRKPVRRMEEVVFAKILDQLSGFGYRGDICLQWYNEPLADRRLVAWTAACRLACPESYIYAASNGDLLTPELFDRLVEAGMSMLNVSQYDGEISPAVQAVLDRGVHTRHLNVGVKGADVLTNSRGGSVVHLSVLDEPSRERCIRPDEQLVVDAHGNVPLCCNDYHGSYRIGSVHERTLLELWSDPRLVAARAALREGDRSKIDVCRACNEPNASYAHSLPKGRGNLS